MHCYILAVASFPVLPRLQFLITCSMQKWIWLRFYILQAIKNWGRRRRLTYWIQGCSLNPKVGCYEACDCIMCTFSIIHCCILYTVEQSLNHISLEKEDIIHTHSTGYISANTLTGVTRRWGLPSHASSCLIFYRNVGMPRLQTVRITNPSKTQTLQLTSISGDSPDFHPSFFKSKVRWLIPAHVPNISR